MPIVETIEKKDKMHLIADNVKNIISLLGEDVNREGLLKTPERSRCITVFDQRICRGSGRNSARCFV